MSNRDQVVIEVGEEVLGQILRERVSRLRLKIRAQAPEVEISAYLAKVRLKIDGWTRSGEVVLTPVGAAGLLSRIFSGVVSGNENFSLVGGKLHIKPLPGGLPLSLALKSVDSLAGSLRIVLAFPTTAADFGNESKCP